MAFSQVDHKDGVLFTGARTANTVGPFVLLGGMYLFECSLPSTSATLLALMPDGTTYQTADNETAAAYKVLDLPPGTFEITFVATADVQGGVIKIPYNPAY
jgi:hypothetical protein